jgi:excisionase family DNA binding protein
MRMRLELGALAVQMERPEDAAEFLRGLMRCLNNREVAEVLGVTDKTVRRWKREGRLPEGRGGQITLLDLLHHQEPQTRGTKRAKRERGRTAAAGG